MTALLAKAGHAGITGHSADVAGVVVESVARVVRGFCVGLIMGAVWQNHGWKWFVVVTLLWLAHLVVEDADRQAVRR